MLKNLDPLLNADILHALCAMGHGDEVVICDANFPADSVARQTVLGHVLRLDGVDAPRAIRAVLSVFRWIVLSIMRPSAWKLSAMQTRSPPFNAKHRLKSMPPKERRRRLLPSNGLRFMSVRNKRIA